MTTQAAIKRAKPISPYQVRNSVTGIITPAAANLDTIPPGEVMLAILPPAKAALALVVFGNGLDQGLFAELRPIQVTEHKFAIG